MPDIKFACPHCQQHIQAPEGYAGMEIACPACQGGMRVPGTPAAPAVPRVSIAAPPPPSTEVGTACPSCGNPMPRAAILCTQCGYNTATGQRTVAGRPAPLPKRKPASGEAPWYATPWPYVGAVLLILGVLYYLGRTNDDLKMAFVAVAALYSFTIHLMVVISAFRNDGAAYGFVSLCVPFGALYYILKVSENDTLKVLYTTAIVINLILKFAID
jgi:hypothetical protein